MNLMVLDILGLISSFKGFGVRLDRKGNIIKMGTGGVVY